MKLDDIPEDYHLSELQKVQVNAYKEGRNYIDEVSIKNFMKEIPIPVLFMDFETFMPAIPMFNNSHPYQQIPFQFSVHHMDEKKKLKHYSFLAEAEGDPRISFIENLLKAIEGEETILVYNQSFEISRLKELAQDFPEYCRQLSGLIIRIKDLMTPFQRKWYYTNDMELAYNLSSKKPI